MSYSYDVFLSYRHAGVVYEWVHNHFYPRLDEWLQASAPAPVAVFIDTSIEAGESWPHALRHALGRSKLMVSVYSPEYFRSQWCLSEFQTMALRQRACGLPSDNDARTLIIPVKFNDGDHFPKEASRITYRDLSPWNFPYEVFEESPRYLEFADEVRSLAEHVVKRLADVPAWSETWEVLDPAELGRPSSVTAPLDFPHL